MKCAICGLKKRERPENSWLIHTGGCWGCRHCIGKLVLNAIQSGECLEQTLTPREAAAVLVPPFSSEAGFVTYQAALAKLVRISNKSTSVIPESRERKE
jgi:hypothetical protein